MHKAQQAVCDPPLTTTNKNRSGLVMICDVDLDEGDATRIHTIEVAAGFATEGFSVDLITRGHDPRLPGVRHHRAKGLEHKRFRRILDVNVRSTAILAMRRPHAARCYVRERWSNLPILLVARLLRYRLVTQVDDLQYGRGHEVEISAVADHGKRLATLLMGRLAHGVVAVTPELKALLVNQSRVPAERIAVLRNGADVSLFTPQPREVAIVRSGLDPSLRYVVFCGSFQPWVDFEVLLDAFALVVDEHPETRLLLVGDGVERRTVESHVRRLGIEDAVIITGFVHDRGRINNLLGAATVTLAAHRADYVSRIGVSPVKLAEYMASGRAVVATDIPGMREVLEQTGAGVVVPADAQLFAGAIIDLLDPQRADALGAIGRRVAEERYAWRSIVQRTLPLFE